MSASSGKHRGEVVSPASEPLAWVDSKGSRWRIQASPLGIRVEGDAAGFEIPREAFGTDVYVSPMGDQVVVRLSGPDDEVGFLVPRSAADELLRRIESRPPTPQQLMDREAQAAAGRRPNWPKMTGVSIAALICASLAFVPFVGVGFALIAVVLLLVERTRSRPGPAWLHIRWMGRISLALSIWGLGVCLFSSWTWLQPAELPVDSWTEPEGYEGGRDWAVIVLSIAVILISLSVHETAHAITAWWCGDDYARSVGRVTLNPLAHIDLFGTVLLPVILAVMGQPVFGYARPVPVRLAGVRRFRRAHILISIAGPGSNLLLAALAFSVLLAAACLLRLLAPHAGGMSCAYLFSPAVGLSGFVGASVVGVMLTAVKLLILVNVFLASFNLIPVPPLDGSWVLEHLLPGSLGRLFAVIRPYGFFIFLVMLWTDVFMYFLLPAVASLAVISVLFSWCIAV